MKSILLLSDTHSFIDDSLLKHAQNVDEIWHAGDIGSIHVTDALANITTLRAVYGNIDNHILRSQFPKDQKFKCENLSVWITHIGGYPGRYAPGISHILDAENPRLFISGHSHILKVMPDKKRNLLFMNPGAYGKVGFHKVRTFLRFQITGDTISNLEVVEYSR